MSDFKKQPAIVRYIGNSNTSFTNGKQYEAFFLEYWQGKRNSLHVRNNQGEISHFNPFDDFEVVSDADHLLNLDEAIVRCITHKYDDQTFDLSVGKLYKAIGCDKDGNYLVMDDSFDCYFYPSEAFEIIKDEKGILSCRSLYYSYFGCKENLN